MIAVLLFRAGLNRLPNRTELGPKTVTLHYQPVRLEAGSGSGFQVVGAWRLLTDDLRFGGLSALALNEAGFIALTDSGVVARFPKPGAASASLSLAELPAGPRSGGFKVNRDSEALVADPEGRGWWVAFENRDELWLYDPAFTRALSRRRVVAAGLSRNRGIEGMVADKAGMLLFRESGGDALRLGQGETVPIRSLSGWISDAVRLPGGGLAVLNRRPTPIGLANWLVMLEQIDGGYGAGEAWRIPVGRLDNVEGLAAESMPGGGVRLWMVTDNNLQQRRPTLLLALELRPRPAR